MVAFTNLKPLGTKIVNALAVSGVSVQVIESAKTINRKLQGKRASSTPPPPPPPTDGTTPPPADTVSSSQQSYDNLIEHFNALIELVSSHSEYNPNEADLKVTALQTYKTALKTANTAMLSPNTAWSNARIARDTILYAEITGLVDVALDVKSYIKSIFSASSPQYKQVSGLQFRKPTS